VLRVAFSFMVTLSPATMVTCADAAKRLVKGKRRWQVRSAGKGSKTDRWHAWAWIGTASPRHHLLIRRPLTTCAVTAAQLRNRTDTQAPPPKRPDQPPAARSRADPTHRSRGKTPTRRHTPPRARRARRALAQLAPPSPVKEARARGYQYLAIRPVARNVAAVRRFHAAGFRTLGGTSTSRWTWPHGDMSGCPEPACTVSTSTTERYEAPEAMDRAARGGGVPPDRPAGRRGGDGSRSRPRPRRSEPNASTLLHGNVLPCWMFSKLVT
jgi:hypothetical protein